MARCERKTKPASSMITSKEAGASVSSDRIHDDIAQVLVEQQSNIVNEMKTGTEIHDPARKKKSR